MASPASWTRILDEADEETARLIIATQLEDIYQLAQADSSADTHTQDFAAARSLYETELQQYFSIRRAEKGEAAFAEIPVVPAAPLVPAKPSFDQIEDGPDTTSVMDRDPTPKISLFECVACGDEKQTDDIWQVPCQHYYCDQCLRGLFRTAMTDESYYPPRCCHQVVPYEDVKLFLKEELSTEFEAKKEELDCQERTYCHDP